MRVRIKLDELVNILIDKKRAALLEKYNLEPEALDRIFTSMERGKWKFIA